MARGTVSRDAARQGAPAILVGVDGGGTRCRARAVAQDGAPIGAAEAGPANINTDIAGATANIVAAVRGALAAGGAQDEIARCHVGLGLAGANVPAAATAVLAAPLPFAAVALEQDSVVACRGAHGDRDGAIAIIGTGTAYVARSGGRFATFGGWGFTVSDQGSGAHLGRAALAAALLAHDELGPASPLTAALMGVYGDPATLAAFASRAAPAEFGAHAPAVVDAADAGDPVGRGLVVAAVAAIEPALRRLVELGAPTIALLGGLAPRYVPYLAADLAARLVAPQGDALDGALHLARTLTSPR